MFLFGGDKDKKPKTNEQTAEEMFQTVARLLRDLAKYTKQDYEPQITKWRTALDNAKPAKSSDSATEIAKFILRADSFIEETLKSIAIEHTNQIFLLINSIMKYGNNIEENKLYVDQSMALSQELSKFVSKKPLTSKQLDDYTISHKDLITQLEADLKTKTAAAEKRTAEIEALKSPLSVLTQKGTRIN
jgi:hypothetical protein